MDYVIKYIGFDEPLGINSFFSKKISKIDKFSWTSKNLRAEFKLNKSENLFDITLILPIPHNNDVVVSSKASDLNAGINEAINKLQLSLVKIKEKRIQK